MRTNFRTVNSVVVIAASALLLAAVGGAPPRAASAQSASGQPFKAAAPTFSEARAFDVSPALTELARRAPSAHVASGSTEPIEIRPDRGPVGVDQPFTGDGALAVRGAARSVTAVISAPLASFEGLSNQDNFNVFGFRVNPPDPVGAVGPRHYVEMVNLVFGVYSKTGALLLGPIDTGTLWSGFAVPDCTDPSGDPIVVHDQFVDRWILAQFTTRGPEFFDCVAVSQTSDPTGAYFRYAFSSGVNFPDYPKYGVWSDSYVLTTREFGPTTEYGIGVYGLEKNKMVRGDPKARSVRFFLDGNDPAVLPLIGDGLLPADVDGKRAKTEVPIPLVGTQDDGAFYGATQDALNIWELDVKWRSTPTASLTLKTQLAVASFDSIFPCAPDSRDCLPQPGITAPVRYLDILSYRQRPTFRLAYRDFGTYEALVTNQSVEALPGVAGVRWYEIRRINGSYSLNQQGTFAPNDGVHRWMGSIAMDRLGNLALGYSVVNGTDVFPGIRYTGRLAGDALGQMTLGEGVIATGTGVQLALNSRWGDYTAMTVDPTDDCTFWYVNEYYTAAGQASSAAGWQTRIASFRLPGCTGL